LSRLQYKETHELPINAYLRDETLLKVTHFDLWYVNIVNYMVAGYVPPGKDKRKLKYQAHCHLWDDPYLYRVCSDGLLRRCVPTEETIKIMDRCHASPYGGHYGAFRPMMYQDTKEFVRRCARYQKHGNINARDAMPL
jgi:hypothetical protein